jgi:hypothetical protein
MLVRTPSYLLQPRSNCRSHYNLGGASQLLSPRGLQRAAVERVGLVIAVAGKPAKPPTARKRRSKRRA